jgi:DNA-binding response OmpR family regulator
LPTRTIPPALSRQILIVDDDTRDLAFFKKILERAGYSVTDSQSGKLGTRALQQKSFDLVILNLNMQDIDGFEMLQIIRDQISKPKILGLSRLMQRHLLTTAKGMGATTILDKGIAPETLLFTIGNLLQA